MTKKFDVYKMVGEQIVELLEQGIIPWDRPWTGTGAAWSRSTGKSYSLLNQILLRESGEYATFNQIQKEGGKVNKGAKSHLVVFWKMYKKEKEDEETGETLVSVRPVLKYYRVFNVKDTTLEQKYSKSVNNNIVESDADAESVIADYVKRSGIGFYHVEGNRAYYSPMEDKVVLPLVKQFKSTDGYYSVAFHELTHSTGSHERLNRIKVDEIAAHGESYAKEELVAEFGSAALCHLFGFKKMIENSASYIQGWATAIKDDPHMFVGACAQADKALAMILGKEGK